MSSPPVRDDAAGGGCDAAPEQLHRRGSGREEAQVHDTANALIELGAVFFGLGMLGRLAWRVSISPIPLHLLGGLAFGQAGLVPPEGIEPFTEIASETGACSCCSCWGRSTPRASWSPAYGARGWPVCSISSSTPLPGRLWRCRWGWGPLGALAMAGITSISSSGIVAKVLGELGRLGNRETPVVLSIPVFEDLAMAVYLPVMTALLAGVSFLGGPTAVGISRS